MLSPEFKPLKAFLFNPSRELYGREIERAVGTTHERNIVYLNELVQRKILIKEKRGKQIFYKLNKLNELVTKSLSFFELERKAEFMQQSKSAFPVHDFVSKVLNEFPTSFYFVLLFGSAARKEEREQSDIDILFVMPENRRIKNRIEKIAKEREMITGKKFSPHIITIKEVEKRWLKEPVYKNIWDERIVFFGEENFWRFVLRIGEPL